MLPSFQQVSGLINVVGPHLVSLTARKGHNRGRGKGQGRAQSHQSNHVDHGGTLPFNNSIFTEQVGIKQPPGPRMPDDTTNTAAIVGTL